MENALLYLSQNKIIHYIKNHQFHKLSDRQLKALIKGHELCDTIIETMVSDCNICNQTKTAKNKVYQHLFHETHIRQRNDLDYSWLYV